MKDYLNEDPFDPAYDPGLTAPAAAAAPNHTPHPCECGIQRRQLLIMAGALASAPVLSSAQALVPCVQTRQTVQPCQHKFCRHYGGKEDYYGR